MKIVTSHWNDDVNIDLEIMRDPLFNGKEVGFPALMPSKKLAEGKQGGDCKEHNSGVTSS